jgi:hypothetical protein
LLCQLWNQVIIIWLLAEFNELLTMGTSNF